MDYRYAFDKTDAKIIDKLNDLDNYKTLYDDVRKLTKNVHSDHNLRKWEMLTEKRDEELRKLAELKFYNHLVLELNDTGSKCIEQFFDYAINNKDMNLNELGGSSLDYILSLKKEYDDLQFSKIITSQEIIDLINGTNEKYDDLLNLDVKEFAKKYELSEKELNNHLYMFFDNKDDGYNYQIPKYEHLLKDDVLEAINIPKNNDNKVHNKDSMEKY